MNRRDAVYPVDIRVAFSLPKSEIPSFVVGRLWILDLLQAFSRVKHWISM
jgi:hypothetical protein